MIDSVVLEAFPDFESLVRSPDDADKAELRATPFNEIPINRLRRFTLDLAEATRAPPSRSHAAAARRRVRPWQRRAAQAALAGVHRVCGERRLEQSFQGVSRTDMVTGEARALPGPAPLHDEPVFLARPGAEAEDDGWLLVLVNDGEAARTGLYVYDAKRWSPSPSPGSTASSRTASTARGPTARFSARVDCYRQNR